MAEKITPGDIEDIMEALQETNSEFAKRLNVSSQTVRNWKMEDRGRIHPVHLAALAKLKRKHVNG